ncbi:MAG TPA: nitrous oxide reductase accessory protein NosL [Thermoanaerobaculia bacterium]|nr:nitrous oxide reductase accessory protein NosL [Thermoanaerobaculia bacterium]
MRSFIILLCALSTLLACSAAPPEPAALDVRNELCAFCRMPVSDPSLAAQLVAPGEEPRFFDDIGCLRDYLSRTPQPPKAVCFVADHRTHAWVRRDTAVYVRSDIATPMWSHLTAYADGASAAADPAARGGSLLRAQQVFGPGSGPSAREAR